MKASSLRILSLLTLAAIWEIGGRSGNAHLLPPLSKVLRVWVELLVSGQLLQAISISFQALAIGFFVSVLFGVPLGLLMGRYRRVESFLEIYMTALLAVPMISFIPLVGVQTALVLSLARIYGYQITLARSRELIVTFGIGLMARSLFYELIKLGGPPGWLVSAGVAAGATTALGYGAAAWFDRGERLSRRRMEGISRSVGSSIVGRLRGRRRPKRAELEQEVGLALEQSPPGHPLQGAQRDEA